MLKGHRALSPKVDGYGVDFKEDLEGKVLPIAFWHPELL